MKKWIYLIVPTVLLALFLVVFFSHREERIAREIALKETLAKKQEEEAQKKKEAEEKAKESARIAQAERDAAEKKKEDERRAKQAAIDKEIADTTAAALADADKFSKEAGQLEVELDRLHKEKDRLGREVFDLEKQVELAKVAKRNAELEHQRMVEMIARRAADSSMTRMPTPPVAAAPAR